MQCYLLGKESVVSSTSIGDQEDTSRTMETDAKTIAAPGRAADHSIREVEPSSSINQPQVEDHYSTAHDHPRREIRKPLTILIVKDL